uniref:Uncharacterized protein n=1 Tax=Rhizophora mucronata TaxID=61149 RepID=A0A2P2M4S2_RHIMU
MFYFPCHVFIFSILFCFCCSFTCTWSLNWQISFEKASCLLVLRMIYLFPQLVHNSAAYNAAP